jgi:hypothetical protein
MANSSYIDFIFNEKLLDHNAHMQEELKEAHLQPTNLGNSTSTIDVKPSQLRTKYSLQSKRKALDDILAKRLTFESSLSSLQALIPNENLVFELIRCCDKNFHKNSKLLVT